MTAVAWDRSGSDDGVIPRAQWRLALGDCVWDATNGWTVPVAGIPDDVWPELALVGGLTLVDDSGNPVGDGSLPPTRPEV